MAKFASPAAPPVLPGAEHILSHRHQHRTPGTDPRWWPELLQQVREGQLQWWDVGTPRKSARQGRYSKQAYP